MLNIEKYKDNIINADQSDITCCVIDLFHNGVCPHDCKDCKKAAMKWLLEEYKEPVLDDVEREYLSATIKPFRKMIAYIVKAQDFDDGKQCIRIILQNGDGMHFPYLNDDAMYKGMEVNKEYSLEELGL